MVRPPIQLLARLGSGVEARLIMPGPVPKSVTGFSHGAVNIVRSEPECMAHVGAVAVGWTEVERSLVHLVANALGPSEMQSAAVVSSSGNWVAKVAMEQAETIRTRLKLVNATVAPILLGSPLLDRWKELDRELQKRSRQRNRIVHAQWAYSGELPGKIVNLVEGAFEFWSVEDFREVIFGLGKLGSLIQGLQHDIAVAKAQGALPGDKAIFTPRSSASQRLGPTSD